MRECYREWFLSTLIATQTVHKHLVRREIIDTQKLPGQDQIAQTVIE